MIANLNKHHDSVQQTFEIVNEPSDQILQHLMPFIDRMKKCFIHNCNSLYDIQLSFNQENQWTSNDEKASHRNILTGENLELPITFEIIRLQNDNKLEFNVHIKTNETQIIKLPIGSCTENELEKQFEPITNAFIEEFLNFHSAFIQ